MHAGGLAIDGDGAERGFADGADALLRAFADHAQRLAVGIEIGDVQCGQFGETQAGGVEQLEHGGVARRHPGGGLLFLGREERSLQKRVHLREGEKGGEVLFRLGQQNGGEGIRREIFPLHEEAIKAAQRREGEALRARERPRFMRSRRNARKSSAVAERQVSPGRNS